MKVKRQKIYRRRVRFFKACFGFRAPFKVLCDGNFIHHVLQLGLREVQESLPAILSAVTKALTTRCVLAELKSLGATFRPTHVAAMKLEVARCSHSPSVSPSDCLSSLVFQGNPEHYFIATQDEDLRRQLRQVSGVALIFARGTSLILEEPSPFQQSIAKKSEGERLRLPEREVKLLEARAEEKKMERRKKREEEQGEKNGLLTIEDVQEEEERRGQAGRGGVVSRGPKRPSAPDSDLDSDAEQGRGPARGCGGSLARDKGAVFKRKLAKAPNPLSCKKKVKKTTGGVSTIGGAEGTSKSVNETLKRPRRRRKGGQAQS